MCIGCALNTMAFSKSFPKKTEKSSYPNWVEISLTKEEETQQEKNAREENISIMKECIEDAKKIIAEKGFKEYQTDLVNIAISLFEKRSSHVIYFKEAKAKEKFDELN